MSASPTRNQSIFLRAKDLTARPVQVALETTNFPSVQAVSTSPRAPFLRTDGRLVGPKSTQLGSRQLLVLDSAPDAGGLTMLARVDVRRRSVSSRTVS